MTTEATTTNTLEYSDNDILRFLDKVELPADEALETECWRWVGARHSKKRGYGKFWLKGKPVNAHKASYLMFIGPVKEGLVLGHECNNEFCVNPYHVHPETQKQNMEYCVKSGRHSSQRK